MKNDINYENAKLILKNNIDAILLDVRSPQEYKEFHLESAINIPLYNIESKVEKFFPNKEKIIILYCQTGSRSKKALIMLKKIGYLNVYNLAGGINSI
jgi:rhodanese-related sulfurtransferase